MGWNCWKLILTYRPSYRSRSSYVLLFSCPGTILFRIGRHEKLRENSISAINPSKWQLLFCLTHLLPNTLEWKTGKENMTRTNATCKAFFPSTMVKKTLCHNLKIPMIWRKADIVAFLKPGKDPTLVKSYQPISLLCNLFTTYERLIVTRTWLTVEINLSTD